MGTCSSKNGAQIASPPRPCWIARSRNMSKLEKVIIDAAVRGMKEELGVEGIEIERLTKFRMNYGMNDNEISELYQGSGRPWDLVKFDPVEIETIAYARHG
jgi:hypothetical protein